MADTKISALTSATLPLSGSELVPIVQSGTTVKTAISNIASNQPPTPYTANGVVYASSTSALATGSGLQFDGTNLGIGVTPSAWLANSKAFQFGSTGSLFNYGAANRLGENVYFNTSGTPTYLANGYAELYLQNGGAHTWSYASSGTAGNAITFIQAMTLDASGNLLLGLTSGSYRFNLKAPTGTWLNFTDGVYQSWQLGNDANGIFYNNPNSGYQAWQIGGTERARIDSSGNLLVNNTGTITTGPTSKVISYAGSASTAAISAQFGNSYTGQLYRADSYTASGTGWSYFMGLSGNGSSVTTTQIQILGNGNIQNTNNSYGAISDVKLKENIVDATPKLTDLMQVKVRNYNLKTDPTHKQLGVVAQELEAIFPSMIEETPDRDEEGNDLGTTTKSVKYSVFVPMLIKAVQELSSKVTALEAKLGV